MSIRQTQTDRQPLPSEMLPRDQVQQYGAYSLFSSFRSLAHTPTLKKVFERKNNQQGTDEPSCSLKQELVAQREEEIFLWTSLACTICTTEKLGLIHKRGEVISKGSTPWFGAKSSKGRWELVKRCRYLAAISDACTLSHGYSRTP